MINPRPIDVLENLVATLDASVLPRLKDSDVLSAATTTRHMLRYVLSQLRHEPASFAAEVPKLTDLLNELRDFLRQVGAEEIAVEVEAQLVSAEAVTELGHEGLAGRVACLREGLHRGHRALINQRSEWSDKPGYAALREAIRSYLAWQNLEEAKIVGPAFYGQGARR